MAPAGETIRAIRAIRGPFLLPAAAVRVNQSESSLIKANQACDTRGGSMAQAGRGSVPSNQIRLDPTKSDRKILPFITRPNLIRLW